MTAAIFKMSAFAPKADIVVLSPAIDYASNVARLHKIYHVVSMKRPQPLKKFTQFERIKQLLLTVVFMAMIFVVLDAVLKGDLVHRFLFPPKLVDGSYGGPDWQNLFQLLIFVLGLPVALLLWHWRDKNVRDQIENGRKDINLKEFHEIQLRLANGLAETVPLKARTTLQIAALFQLTSFLRGERGEDFIRPAYEAFRAKLDADFEEAVGADYYARIERLENIYQKALDSNVPAKYQKIQHKIHSHINPLIGVKRAYRNQHRSNVNQEFLRKNIDAIEANELPLESLNCSFLAIFRDFSDANFHNSKFINCIFSGIGIEGGLNLNSCQFFKADMTGVGFHNVALKACQFHSARLDRAIFSNTTFEECDFSGSKFRTCSFQATTEEELPVFKNCIFTNSDLSFVHMMGANFDNTDFSGSKFVGTSADNCSLSGSNLSDCDLRGAHFTGIDPRTLKSCQNAVFDDHTFFHLPAPDGNLHWNQADLDEIRNLWRSCGARHVDDPPGQAAVSV